MKLPPTRLFLMIALSMVASAVLAWVGIQWMDTEKTTHTPTRTEQGVEPNRTPVPSHTTATPVALPPNQPKSEQKDEPTANNAPKVAIVIDDVGLRETVLDAFWAIPNLGNGLSWAVIPGAQFANALTADLAARKACIIAHIPMEPIASENITTGLGDYLLVSDGPSGLETKLQKRMDTFPASLRSHVVGLSNHQGSLLTTNQSAMNTILSFAHREKLFFLDSRTTHATIGKAMAKRHGVATAERNVFLDNVREPEAIERQLDELLDIATQKGSGIGIGHPYPETAIALARWLRKTGTAIQLVPVDQLLQ